MPCLPYHSLNAQGIAVNASMCRLAVRSFVAYAQPKSRLQNHCIERNRVNTWGFAPASAQVLKHYLWSNGAAPTVADKVGASKTLAGNELTPPRANAPAGSGCDSTKLAVVV